MGENIKKGGLKNNLGIIVPQSIIPVRQLNSFQYLLDHVSKLSDCGDWIAYLGEVVTRVKDGYTLYPFMVAKLFGVSRSWIYKLIKGKQLKSKQKCYKCRHRITLHSINEYLKQK